jgi:hypothetical protein
MNQKPEVEASVNRVLSLQQIDEAHGLGPCLYLAAIHGVARDQSELASTLIERLDERDRLVKAGDTQAVGFGRAISNKHVNYLVAECLDRLAENGSPPPLELIALIKRQLGATEPPTLDQADESRNVRDVEVAAMDILAAGGTPTFRKVASKLGVEPSTVTRWFSESQRLELPEYWRRLAGEFKKPRRAIKPSR